MKKRALITGITGQDGSYLADFLLAQGYEVTGMVRRSSTENFERINHLRDRIRLVQGDLLDQLSIISLVKEVRPHEVYNLAAQSFVPTSWNQPVLTGEFTAIGVTRMLEAIKLVDPSIRYYQASSSEMFGKVRETPQNENTPFYPRSPYGVAKVYGHWITVNYRESYDLFACSGILFNHESVPGWTPVLIRRDGRLDLLPIEEMMPNHTHERERPLEGVEVWEDGRFVPVIKATAYPHDAAVSDKGVTEIAARCGVIEATRDHVIFTPEGEVPAGDLSPHQRLIETDRYPKPLDRNRVTEAWARFVGLFVGDGHAGWSEGRFQAWLRSDDPNLLEEAAGLWESAAGGTTSYSDARSGSSGERIARGCLNLNGAPGMAEWLASTCYTQSRHKRVPKQILNAGLDVWRAFLTGYNRADGLEKGHGTYEYKNFKTNSPTLASQLMWMAEWALGQRTVVHVNRVERGGEEYRYYSINLNSPDSSREGAHLVRDRDEILHVRPMRHRGFLFDLTTESGRFSAGVGNVLIHNSPRRGREFVTRKVSWAVARIRHGLQEKLRLGNLDAKRDWGYAGDYVQAMWRMLQQDAPDDFVIATGISHSVQDLVRIAFGCADMDWEEYVEIDKALMRPADVDHLLGDPSKAKRVLGWNPEVDFEGLIEMMVKADIDTIRGQIG